MRTPTKVPYLFLECTCSTTNISHYENLMHGATIANKKTINRIVKEHLPGLYEDISLQFDNPYKYYKTKTHLILRRPSLAYFLRYR